MAERRMFHTAVVESDAFYDLAIGAQALYFHLGMSADDDGFINSPKLIARKLGRPAKELQLLIDKGFVLNFDGIVVLKHWLVANSLKTDRMKALQYPDIAEKLYVTDNRHYVTEPLPGKVNLLKTRQEKLDSIRNPKVREGKVREDNIREDKISEGKVREGNTAAAAGLPAMTYDDDKNRKKDSVIKLELWQANELMELMGVQEYCRYRKKLEDFIRDNDAHIKDQYETLRKWWQADRR